MRALDSCFAVIFGYIRARAAPRAIRGVGHFAA